MGVEEQGKATITIQIKDVGEWPVVSIKIRCDARPSVLVHGCARLMVSLGEILDEDPVHLGADALQQALQIHLRKLDHKRSEAGEPSEDSNN